VKLGRRGGGEKERERECIITSYFKQQERGNNEYIIIN